MNPNNKGEILPAGEMQKKYGLYAGNREIFILDPNNVPEALRHLIPLAERWGEGDDIIRGDMIEKAPAEELQSLQRAVAEYEDLLDEWLGGPQAAGPKYSKEYSAFSYMMRAAGR